MKEYKKRIIDEVISRKLEAKGAILIEGPKWCGKTTSAEQIAKSISYMADPKKREQNIELANVNPQLLLEGDVPRLIDEWQIAPKLWDAVRYEVDHRDEEGQFILTGSSTPVDKNKIFHTGTGRFARVLMRPMSLFESGESNGTVRLEDLFNNKNNIQGVNNLKIEDIAYLCCRGGWPKTIFQRESIALESAFDYYDSIVDSDILKSKDNERLRHLMRSYARHQGTQATNVTLKKDILANDVATLHEDTIYSYINILKESFVIEESLAWNPNLRSKAAIRTSDTRYYIDPSIATAALGLGPKDLINDLKTFGFIFETLCIRDLRVYADSLDGKVYHFRDSSNLECDAVLHLRNGDYGLIEIKLGGEDLIKEGIENLTKLKNNINSDVMKSPSFLMVLVGVGDYAYKNEDGIYIVPIGCLKN